MSRVINVYSFREYEAGKRYAKTIGYIRCLDLETAEKKFKEKYDTLDPIRVVQLSTNEEWDVGIINPNPVELGLYLDGAEIGSDIN